MATGIPLLEQACDSNPAALAFLTKCVEDARRWLP
jgi:hypothetical protein